MSGSTETGESDEKRTDESAREPESAARQGSRPAGLGTTYEQSGHDSGRNGAEQRNLQLDLFDITEEPEDIEEVEKNIFSIFNF